MKDNDQDTEGFFEDNSPEADSGKDSTVRNTKLLFATLVKEKLSPDEKILLWNHILDSIPYVEAASKRKSIRVIFWYQIAAAVALFLLAGIGYKWMMSNDANAMKEMADLWTISHDDTRLILADARTIQLKGEHSAVVYQKEVIRLDSAVVAKNLDDRLRYALNTLVVPYGKRSTITLSDGTRVWLNSGSKLVYPSDFRKGKREVFLEGQAYFSVSHDAESPFYVQTENMAIKVLGTEFDISSYGDDQNAYAVLVTGTVELETGKDAFFGGKKRKMLPGMRAVYSDHSNELEMEKVSVEDYISWKDGYLVLKKEPLDQILKKLSRYYKYDLSVKNEDVGKDTFSGTLDLQDNIDQVIEIIANISSLNYHKSERRFVLEKRTKSD